MQIQQRQHFGDLRGLAAPGRQDHRGVPVPLAGGLVDTLFVDPRCADLDRAGRGEHPPRHRVAVSHHQPVAVLVELPPGAVAHDLIDQRPAGRGGLARRLRHGRRRIRGRWRRNALGDYGEHGRTFPTRVGARACLIPSLGLLGKVRLPKPIHRFQALLSRTLRDRAQTRGMTGCSPATVNWRRRARRTTGTRSGFRSTGTTATPGISSSVRRTDKS
jgi:hypothetical protein